MQKDYYAPYNNALLTYVSAFQVRVSMYLSDKVLTSPFINRYCQS